MIALVEDGASTCDEHIHAWQVVLITSNGVMISE